MNKQDIQRLYGYNRWANATVKQAAAPLTTDEFTRNLGGSFPSVRDTMVHIMAAEWIWLRRWKGVSPREFLAYDRFPTFDALKEKWLEIETEQMGFVAEVTDQSLKEIINYVNLKGERRQYPLGDLMQHVVNHCSYHRGQITNFLRLLGAEPKATDFLIYFEVEGRETP
jgi:uncharacterized damage-inducible protein DinB